MPETLAERLAEYAISTRFDDLPHLVVHETKRRLIDALGCALGARCADTPRVAERVASRIAAEPAATTLYGSRTSPDMAAFVNGILLRYLDFNDTYLSKEPVMLGSIKGQDMFKLLLLIYIVVGIVLASALGSQALSAWIRNG